MSIKYIKFTAVLIEFESYIAVGCASLKKAHIHDIRVESFGDAQSAAEGALLSNWIYDEYRSKKKPETSIQLYGENGM